MWQTSSWLNHDFDIDFCIRKGTNLRKLQFLSVVVLLAALFALPVAAQSTVVTEDTVNSFMHWMFGQDATLQWKVVSIKPSTLKGLMQVTVLVSLPDGNKQQWVIQVGEDGKYAMSGDLMPFGADPFAADRAKLSGVNGIVVGPKDAPVTIVEFSDLQCPHCKKAHPVVEHLLKDEPNVRFVFQNFPLPMHNWAAKGANYADCVGRKNPDQLLAYLGAVFDDQENITEATADDKLKAAVTKAGGDAVATAACAALPETTTRVQKSLEFGATMDVTSTPTVFINGRRIQAIADAPYEVMKGIVDFNVKEMSAKK